MIGNIGVGGTSFILNVGAMTGETDLAMNGGNPALCPRQLTLLDSDLVLLMAAGAVASSVVFVTRQIGGGRCPLLLSESAEAGRKIGNIRYSGIYRLMN